MGLLHRVRLRAKKIALGLMTVTVNVLFGKYLPSWDLLLKR
jgi:hypothetical protein